MHEGAQIVLQQLKLDLVASCNFSWREAHNKILLRRFIGLVHWTRSDIAHIYQLLGAQGSSFCPTPLGFSAPGLPGFDRY